jgi:hypothetical protein
MADTKLSALSFGTTPDLIYGIQGGVAKKYSGAGVFNVRDFGALGNSTNGAVGGQDDTTYIQAAIAALEAAGGGTLYFPRGYYRITAPLVIDAACAYEIAGSSRYTTYIVGDFDGFLIARHLYANGAVPIYIHGINFRNIHATLGGCIYLLSSDGSKVEWCSLQASKFGVQMGGDGSPTTATFTANSTGTSMVVTGITGTITNSSGATIPLPVRLAAGAGVPASTSIMSQSGGYTGGNGTYITNNVTTCSGSTVSTSPDAPTCMSSVISHCHISGTGTFNANPAISFNCVGVQMSPNTIVRDCHINNCATAIRAYGGGNTIIGCQLESNTVGICLGKDGMGDFFTSIGATIIGCQIESNYTGIHLYGATHAVIISIIIQGNQSVDHNSTHGVLIDGAGNCTLSGVIITGTFLVDSFYVQEASYQTTGMTLLGCQGTISKDAAKNYSGIRTISCGAMGNTTCTLANLTSLASALAAGSTPMSKGEQFAINDASVALGSQTFGATVTGGGSNFARVFYDTGTTFRYG